MGIAIIAKIECTYTCDRCAKVVQEEHAVNRDAPSPPFPTGWAWHFACGDQGYMPFVDRNDEVKARWCFGNIPLRAGEVKTLCPACSGEFSRKSPSINVGPTRQAVTELVTIQETLRANPCHHRGEQPDPNCMLCEFRLLLKIV